MKKNKKILLTLFVLFILILCLFILTSSKELKNSKVYITHQPISKVIPLQEKLLNINYNDVTSIKYSSNNNQILLLKNNAKWSINNQNYNRIDYIKIDIILRVLLNIEPEDTVSSTLNDIGQWGINEKPGQIVIYTPNNNYKINVGSSNPSKTGHYIQVEGSNNIYLIRDNPYLYLTLTIDDIRNRKLPVLNVDKIKSITIINNRKIKIEPYKTYDKFTANVFIFMLTKPFSRNIPLDNQKLSLLLKSLKKSLEIVDFIDDANPSKFGLTKNSKQLSFLDTIGNSFDLIIGNNKNTDTVYAKLKDSDQIFTLNTKELMFLNIEPLDIMDKFAHLISIDSIDSIKLTTENKIVEGKILRGKYSTSYLINNKQINEKIFKGFYEDLIYLLIEGEADSKKLTKNKIVTISFRLDGTESEWTYLNFYMYDDEFYAVSQNNETPQFLIGRYQIEEMLRKISKI